ncbi:MAG: ABC transporter ATP-binding protein, partial [Candidatus Heimdallarchaeota archaeon]|nr:ABC transporter ATP-binding protein [Candidatus Heimdallarchaeota archaeon]MCK5143874.1 ABC transporter ATP-binding protein [Candidatus Heimdallarchaeota archaeon]
MYSDKTKTFQMEPLPEDLALQAIDIYHVYGLEHQNKVVALKGVSFDIKKSEILGIIGPSGSGKSTLLLSLGGMLKPSAGQIFYSDGTDITKLAEERQFEYRRHNIGYVFQEQNLIPYLSAEKNIEMPMRLVNLNRSKRKQRVKELMETLGIWHRRTHTPKRISGGEQQRVSIARALANNPRLIFADEPTGNVDTETSTQILELFKELKEDMGTSYLICSHDPIVGDFSDRTLEIRDGILIGEHLKDIDLTDLDSSRFLVIDNQNRITLPEKAISELRGSLLYTWSMTKDGLLLKPLRKLDESKESKIKICTTCGADIPK